jgi:hypothetical protein
VTKILSTHQPSSSRNFSGAELRWNWSSRLELKIHRVDPEFGSTLKLL